MRTSKLIRNGRHTGPSGAVEKLALVAELLRLQEESIARWVRFHLAVQSGLLGLVVLLLEFVSFEEKEVTIVLILFIAVAGGALAWLITAVILRERLWAQWYLKRGKAIEQWPANYIFPVRRDDIKNEGVKGVVSETIEDLKTPLIVIWAAVLVLTAVYIYYGGP